MSFYRDLLDEDRIFEGLNTSTPSYARTCLELFALQEMSPEARLEKAERIEDAFAKIREEWAEEGFANDTLGNVSGR